MGRNDLVFFLSLWVFEPWSSMKVSLLGFYKGWKDASCLPFWPCIIFYWTKFYSGLGWRGTGLWWASWTERKTSWPLSVLLFFAKWVNMLQILFTDQKNEHVIDIVVEQIKLHLLEKSKSGKNSLGVTHWKEKNPVSNQKEMNIFLHFKLIGRGGGDSWR